MSFLVDSVTMELTRQQREIHLVIHPQFDVVRDITGVLQSVHPIKDETKPAEAEAVRESWMHIEISRLGADEDPHEIEESLQRVLREVRESVEDWEKMRAQALEIVDQLTDAPPPLDDDEIDQGRAFLQWLADDHFAFLGYREYHLEREGDDEILRAVPGTGLGILRADQDQSKAFAKLPAAAKAKAREKTLLVLSKANSRATVHRPAYFDYVGVKTFDENGEVTGERRFLGLLSSAAYTESITRIPLLREKAALVLQRIGVEPHSHAGKSLMDTLETYPRDEIFHTPAAELADVTQGVLQTVGRRQLRVFVRRETYGRYVSVLCYLPRDRYNTAVRERFSQILMDRFHGDSIEFNVKMSESTTARVHFVVHPPIGAEIPDVDASDLERTFTDASRSWRDDFITATVTEYGEDRGSRLARRYADSFPEAYKEDFSATTAALDVGRLEAIDVDEATGNGHRPLAVLAAGRRARARPGSRCSASAGGCRSRQVLPMLSSMGVEVLDERPYELVGLDRETFVYEFGLHYPPRPARRRTRPVPGRDPGRLGRLQRDRRLQRAGARGRADLAAGDRAPRLREVHEAGQLARSRSTTSRPRCTATPTSPGCCGSCSRRASTRARTVSTRRPRPAPRGSRRSRSASSGRSTTWPASTTTGSCGPTSPTSRRPCAPTTSRRPADGSLHPYMSFKMEPSAIPDLPEPRPRFEIFVYSPRVEGVHLRFGAVARGGLRWSDRRDDFRTEVLGLVKAQMVKNTVIVPVGAKGGFFCKQLPDPSDREAWLAEGVACYRTFISGLLDITDNLVEGETVPPMGVVRHDGDDSYLVVAADKGTATFSDIANGVAKDYGFWLGDAFASGGSVGYDHKAMGITARGAWVSVRRHFRERGIDCQTEDFTAVGIGDMSGDVFGNGMLCSEHTRLVAAFDHRDIFIDPDPDAATSFAERKRLFDLPRSSWQDYDKSLISEGGGVFPRTLKAIKPTPQMKQALGIDDSVLTMTPAELMKAILQAPVDLLWNGGIGTYVKAASETNADAGDKANDAIRINGRDLRAQCVGEGGNLGLTQLGRIEYAERGGRMNTDFIDNSAGVDTSDHEVNIKILLDRVVLAGDLTEKQRNALLAQMTDEVAALVLRDNYEQNLALANAAANAPSLLHVHEDWMRQLEKRGVLNRDLEGLPSTRQVRRMLEREEGLSVPELSVLLAWTKIVLAEELLDSDLPDDPYCHVDLTAYFPQEIQDGFAQQIGEHPLRREIIVTQVVNDLVNGAGLTYWPRLQGETGAGPAELTRANFVAREIFGSLPFREELAWYDNKLEAAVQTRMRIEMRTLVERASRWLVTNRRPPLDSQGTVEFFRDRVQAVMAELPSLLTGRELDAFESRKRLFVEAGQVPEDLAARVAVLHPAYQLLFVLEIADREGLDPVEVTRVHFALAERLGLPMLVGKILALPRDDRWQTMARATLRDDVYAVHAQLTAQVLRATDASEPAPARIATWEEDDSLVVARAASTLEDICADETGDLARMSVGLRVVRGLLSS